MTRTITPYEQHGVCSVVEGPAATVNKFLTNAGHGVRRGRSQHSAIDDPLVTNQRNVVKVTSYEPVIEPLGMPTLNFFDNDLQIGATEEQPEDYQPQQAPPAPALQQTKKKPGLFVGGYAPIDNGPLGLPDMQWNEPSETVEGERPRTNAAPQSGGRADKRQAKTGGGPLGLPQMDW